MSGNRIVTVDERQPGTTYIGIPPAAAVLPDGRRLRVGYTVTGSYWGHDDVRGPVIGWNPDVVVVAVSDSVGATSIELGPENILTIEENR
ncbi:hypothetical protein ACWKSP_22290 [Micromonosporaceae bacterium Da 78-11]